MADMKTRHLDYIMHTPLNIPITIIGCGSLGTATAELLTRIGFTNFTLWDHDIVEEHNIGNQYFTRQYIGQQKTEALAQHLMNINNNITITTFNTKWEQGYEDIDEQTVYITTVDSNNTRKAITAWLSTHAPHSIILDGRMGGETGIINLVTPTYYNEYLQSIIEDNQTTELPCTGRTIIYNVTMTASIMTKTLTRYLNKTPEETWENYITDTHNITIFNNTPFMVLHTPHQE